MHKQQIQSKLLTLSSEAVQALVGRSILRCLPQAGLNQPDEWDKLVYPLLRASLVYCCPTEDRDKRTLAAADADNRKLGYAMAHSGHAEVARAAFSAVRSISENSEGERSRIASGLVRTIEAVREARVTTEVKEFYQRNGTEPKGKKEAVVARLRFETEGREDESAATNSLLQDFEKLASGISPMDLARTPIWPGGAAPKGMRHSCDEFFSKIDLMNKKFSFWKDWYMGFATGDPISWNTQRYLMSLDNNLWLSGPAEINQIGIFGHKKYQLYDSATDAINYLGTSQERRANIGHNMPPEQLGDVTAPHLNLSPLKDQLVNLKKDISTGSLSVSSVTEVRDNCRKITQDICDWLAAKSDKAAEEFFKSIGKGAGIAVSGALGLWLFGLAEKLMEIVSKAAVVIQAL